MLLWTANPNKYRIAKYLAEENAKKGNKVRKSAAILLLVRVDIHIDCRLSGLTFGLNVMRVACTASAAYRFVLRVGRFECTC